MPGTAFTLLIGMAPLPPPVLDAVQQVEVEASLDVASAFRLRLGIEQTAVGDWSVLQEDLFRPLVPVAVRIQTGVGVPEAIINGYVAGHRVTYADEPGGSMLEVSGLDVTALMNLQEKVVAWSSLPDGAIAAAIFGQYAVIPRVQPTPPSLVEPEGTTIQRTTDIRFLRRLAQRNGFHCYVQPEPLSGLDQGFFEPPRAMPGVPAQAVLSVNMGEQTNVRQFRVRYEMLRPTGATAASVDVLTKAPQVGVAPASLLPPLGAEGTLTRVIPPPMVRPVGTGLARSADLQSLAQAVVDRSTWTVLAEGEVDADVGVLRPGAVVNVRGAGRLYNGSYYVSRVLHTITRDSYVQRFEARRNAVTMTGAELFVDLP